MQNFKLLMSDIDETLITHGNDISQLNLEVLEKLLDRNIIVIPTTGRFHNSIPPFLLENKRIEYFVSSNGALIKKGEKIIFEKYLEKDHVIEVLELIDKEADHIFIVCANKFIIDERILKSKKEFTNKSFFKRMIEKAIVVDNILEFTKNNDFNVLKLEASFPDLDKRDLIYGKLKENSNFNSASSHVHNIEITNIAASKGHALEFIKNELDLDKLDIIAIGDNDNDISMLQNAGLAVAMGNASDEVKSHSDYVSKDVLSDGFAHAIKKYFKDL